MSSISASAAAAASAQAASAATSISTASETTGSVALIKKMEHELKQAMVKIQEDDAREHQELQAQQQKRRQLRIEAIAAATIQSSTHEAIVVYALKHEHAQKHDQSPTKNRSPAQSNPAAITPLEVMRNLAVAHQTMPADIDPATLLSKIAGSLSTLFSTIMANPVKVTMQTSTQLPIVLTNEIQTISKEALDTALINYKATFTKGCGFSSGFHKKRSIYETYALTRDLSWKSAVALAQVRAYFRNYETPVDFSSDNYPLQDRTWVRDLYTTNVGNFLIQIPETHPITTIQEILALTRHSLGGKNFPVSIKLSTHKYNRTFAANFNSYNLVWDLKHDLYQDRNNNLPDTSLFELALEDGTVMNPGEPLIRYLKPTEPHIILKVIPGCHIKEYQPLSSEGQKLYNEFHKTLQARLLGLPAASTAGNSSSSGGVSAAAAAAAAAAASASAHSASSNSSNSASTLAAAPKVPENPK